jgi:hypothetical protein
MNSLGMAAPMRNSTEQHVFVDDTEDEPDSAHILKRGFLIPLLFTYNSTIL